VPPAEDVLDLFLSHASEDTATVARPLYAKLVERGLTVWFDDAELQIGDSLSRKIDDGLSRCRFGVVVLSRSFFAKEWPQRELAGLASREAAGEALILPVWHEVERADVIRWSPVLADKLAVPTSAGLDRVAELIEKRARRARLTPGPPTSEVPVPGESVRAVSPNEIRRPGESGARPRIWTTATSLTLGWSTAVLGSLAAVVSVAWLAWPRPVAAPPPSPAALATPTPQATTTPQPNPGRPVVSTPDLAADAFSKAFADRDFGRVSLLLADRMSSTDRELGLAQLRALRDKRPPGLEPPRLVFSARQAFAPVGSQLVPGSFALVRTASTAGALTLCDDVWLESGSGGWGVLSFFTWPGRSDGCSGPPELDQASGAATRFLAKLDATDFSGAYPLLGAEYSSRELAEKQMRLFHDMGAKRVGKRRRLMAVPTGFLNPLPRFGDFVFVRFVSEISGGAVFEDVGLERLGDGSYPIVLFLASPAPPGFLPATAAATPVP